MQYDPKLKKAMQEMQEILKKYNIAGTICLHSPGFREYITHINPSWSCLWWDMDGKAIRMKATKDQFYGDAQLRNTIINNSMNMIQHFTEYAGSLFLMMDNLTQTLKDAGFEIIPGEGSGSSHTE